MGNKISKQFKKFTATDIKAYRNECISHAAEIGLTSSNIAVIFDVTKDAVNEMKKRFEETQTDPTAIAG